MTINTKAVGYVLFALSTLGVFTGADWLRFRGPNGSGVAEDEQIPTSWSEEENIAWKVELPGRGVSCPIVIGDRVVLTYCSGYRQDVLHVVCYDAKDAKKRWERQLWATGRTMTHGSISTAASTPVSDGQRIFASFSTNDIASFDLDGNLLWLRGLLLEYPNASNSLGLASSPLVVGNTLVLQIENDSQSLALGLDATTGQTRWKLDRPSRANWTSPVLIQGDEGGSPLVAIQSGTRLTAHRPHTGEEVWRHSRDCDSIPSSVAHDNVIYLPSDGLTALRHNPGSTGPETLWKNNRLSVSTPTPLVYAGKIFTVNGSILKCADTASGNLLWQIRLKGNFSSSPTAAGGRIYLFNSAGLGQVIELGEEKGRHVGGGDLGETILCSPAIADGALYIRSDHHLWKIAKTGG